MWCCGVKVECFLLRRQAAGGVEIKIPEEPAGAEFVKIPEEPAGAEFVKLPVGVKLIPLCFLSGLVVPFFKPCVLRGNGGYTSGAFAILVGLPPGGKTSCTERASDRGPLVTSLPRVPTEPHQAQAAGAWAWRQQGPRRGLEGTRHTPTPTRWQSRAPGT